MILDLGFWFYGYEKDLKPVLFTRLTGHPITDPCHTHSTPFPIRQKKQTLNVEKFLLPMASLTVLIRPGHAGKAGI